jgi:hypothetical protein
VIYNTPQGVNPPWHTLLDSRVFLTIWYMRLFTPLRRLMEILRQTGRYEIWEILTALQFDLRCVVSYGPLSPWHTVLWSLFLFFFSGDCSARLSDSCVHRIRSNAFCSSLLTCALGWIESVGVTFSTLTCGWTFCVRTHTLEGNYRLSELRKTLAIKVDLHSYWCHRTGARRDAVGQPWVREPLQCNLWPSLS